MQIFTPYIHATYDPQSPELEYDFLANVRLDNNKDK